MRFCDLRIVAIAALAIAFGPVAGESLAQPHSEHWPLFFGEVAVTNNNAVHSIILEPNGSYSASSNNIIFLDAPTPGVYDFTGLPGDSVLNITFTADDVVRLTPPHGEPFELVDFTYIPNPATSDAGGNARITVGATLRTTGTFIPYRSGTYQGEVTIDIEVAL